MPTFFTKAVSGLHSSKTKPELFSYLFWRISQRLNQQALPDKERLRPLLSQVKTWIANHAFLTETAIAEHLLSAEEALGKELFEELSAVNKISCKTVLSPGIRWENPFYRYFESQLAVVLLAKPTKAIMASVKLVSQRMITILEQNRDHPSLKLFLERISLLSHEQEAFGKLGEMKVTVDAVLALLRKNEAKDFHHLLLIHYSFARYSYRELENVSGGTEQPLLIPGVFKQYLDEREDKPETVTHLSQADRKDFIDGFLRGSAYFRDWRQTRGRGSFSEGVDSNQMGVMLRKHYPADLPTLALPQKWSPDAICQEPAYESTYVQDILMKDLLYVSGPSGMTTLFLGMSELFAVHPTAKSKENYALASAIFLVSGGLHAWHEVFAVAHDLLDYFPSYVCGHYEQIFKHFEDELGFKECVEEVWQNFYVYCDKQFRTSALHQELKSSYRGYFESKLALALGQEEVCFKTVSRLSLALKNLLVENSEEALAILAKKPAISKELYHPHYFGSVTAVGQDPQTILEDLVARLSLSSANLVGQLHIHSVFARHFFDELTVHQAKGLSIAHVGSDRGRKVVNQAVKPSLRLGIARLSIFNQRLGKSAQEHLSGIDEFGPDFKSPFYLAMAGKDLPFVSGASGHTVKLLSLAKQTLDLPDEELKEYALACFAYLAAGGNHSYHEVIQIAKEQGLAFGRGGYFDSLPKSFKASTACKALEAEFPQYLPRSSL